MTAQRFVRTLSLPRRLARTAVLHTRFGTQGSELDPNNNHPIRVENIVGVHNGMVRNDWELFREMDVKDRRIAQVDSEAIFATLAYGREPYGSHPQTSRVPGAQDVMDLLAIVEGSAAVAWLDMNDEPDVLHVSRITGNPVVWGQTDEGSFVFASTDRALTRACQLTGLNIVHMDELADGQYVRVKNGMMTDFHAFDVGVQDFARAPRHYYGSSSFGGTTTSYPKHYSWEDDDDMDLYRKWMEDNTQRLNAAAKDDPNYRQWVPSEENEGYYRRETEKEVQDRLARASEIADAQQELNWDDEDMVTTDDCGSFPGWVSTKYLAFDKKREPLTEGDYVIDYAERDRAARKWFEELKEPSEVAAQKLRNDLHYWLRPGDWVFVTVAGEDTHAQVLTLPDTFPHGQYVLRAVVRNKERTPEWEAVYISRLGHEMESAGMRTATRALEAPAETKEEVNANV